MPVTASQPSSQPLPQLRLPERFEGTIRRDGIDDQGEYQRVVLRIERQWVDKEGPENLLFSAIFTHFGQPPFGRGFMMTETDGFGSIHRVRREFRITETLVRKNGTTFQRFFEGIFPENFSHLFAKHGDGSGVMHLFAAEGTR